jgi:hypothetical protein
LAPRRAGQWRQNEGLFAMRASDRPAEVDRSDAQHAATVRADDVVDGDRGGHLKHLRGGLPGRRLLRKV